MTCEDLDRTQLLADNELDGEDARKAEAHVKTCADCTALLEDARALRDAIRSSAKRHAAPELLKARIRRDIAAEAKPARGFWLGAASGVGASALAAALALFVILPPSTATLADNIADSHVQAMMSGRLIQVASSDHHTVKPWFAGKIDLSPQVTDFKAQGFTLVGGRLDRVGSTPAAVVVYRHGAHVIDLYVWHGATAAPSATHHGYGVQSWTQGDLDYSAVSDVAPDELHAFVRLVRNTRE